MVKDFNPEMFDHIESGQEFWQHLDQLSQTREFEEWLNQEIPPEALQQMQGFNRRNFIKIMAASFAMSGLTACAPQPSETIVPYVREPRNRIPGKPQYFATALKHKGVASGVLVENHEGRPTKIEGNPEHPSSLGAADIFCQAEILQLYDPDRSKSPLYKGQVSSWDHFQQDINNQLDKIKNVKNEKIRLLTGDVTSPFLLDQIKEFLNKYPQAKWYTYEPWGMENYHAGCQLAFGQELQPIYDFKKAKRIVSLDCDFLFEIPGNIRYASDFASLRDLSQDQSNIINRLYVIESALSLTGSNADNRLALKPSLIYEAALYIASNLNVSGIDEDLLTGNLSGTDRHFLDSLIEDVAFHKETSLFLAGPSQPPIVHALMAKINASMNNQGETVSYIQPYNLKHNTNPHSIHDLQNDMTEEDTQLLLMLGCNPAYNSPANVHAIELIKKAEISVHMGLYQDETGVLSNWHLPLTHDLESWSDGYAYDGTISIIQPLIHPLYSGKTEHQFFSYLLNNSEKNADLLLRNYWKNRVEDNFDEWWKNVLRKGVVPGSSFEFVKVSFDDRLKFDHSRQYEDSKQIELIIKPDETVWDGKFANNGWLQELPKNTSKLTWDNAAFICPETAFQFSLESGTMVSLKHDGHQLEVPVWIVDGMADQCISLSLGYGRKNAGRVGNNTGFDAYQLIQSDKSDYINVSLTKTAKRYNLVSAQTHNIMHDRELVQHATIEEFQNSPDEIIKKEGHHESLYPGWKYDGQQWGMSIDLTKCIGCSACTIACQAENNIPIVGKEEVDKGREMHWIRIDRYVHHQEHNTQIYHQPVPCMHCENAPCEVVCPVAATVHSHDGLNDMIYNRCIGTRYCSNNCPYKVRRFNFFRYIESQVQSLKPMRNPDVTLRARGVMEKCTYCVQRIRQADIEAAKENRPIADGEVVTACQQTCPTNAIQFGDVNDPDTLVSQEKNQPHSYGMLSKLNTRPRTTYLAAIRNPNPQLKEQAINQNGESSTG